MHSTIWNRTPGAPTEIHQIQGRDYCVMVDLSLERSVGCSEELRVVLTRVSEQNRCQKGQWGRLSYEDKTIPRL